MKDHGFKWPETLPVRLPGSYNDGRDGSDRIAPSGTIAEGWLDLAVRPLMRTTPPIGALWRGYAKHLYNSCPILAR